MKPHQVATKLRRIAAIIENSKNPHKGLVSRDLRRVLAAMGEGTTLLKGTRIEDFLSSLPVGTVEVLLDLEPNGKVGAQTYTVPGLGRVSAYLGACSEGTDRGGYVKFYELLEVSDEAGRPVVLEAETDGSELYFDGRMTIF